MNAAKAFSTLGFAATVCLNGTIQANADEQAHKQRVMMSIVQTMEEIAELDADTLANARLVCINGLAGKLRQRQIGRGHEFPEVHIYCRAAEQVAAQRGLWRDLFVALTLHVELQLAEASLSVDSGRVTRGQVDGVLTTIGHAALAGEASFVGPKGEEYAFRPELAFAAGVAHALSLAGRGHDDPKGMDDETAAQSCFRSKPSDMIVVNGEAIPSRRACYLLGIAAGNRARA